MKSWRTTLAGWAVIVTAIAGTAAHFLQGQPVDWFHTAADLGVGLGLIGAGDNALVQQVLTMLSGGRAAAAGGK